MSAHTPGPWRRARRQMGRLMDVVADRGEALSSACVARDMEKADADLIAAAPDMLAACEAVLVAIEGPGGELIVRGGGAGNITRERVRAAIAKARGK